jgi:hypothetical protein
MEVKVKLENCIKRAGEDVSVPVHTVYKEELSDTYVTGCDMVTEISKYESVKTCLCLYIQSIRKNCQTLT